MAATTTLLGLVTPTQGTLSGTWGDTVNYGISDYVDISVAGTLTLTNDGAVTLANTTGSSSGNSITSSLTGAGTVTAQFAIVKVTGTLTTAKVVTAPSYSKTYTVVNSATGGIVTFKASGQTGVSIAVGESAFVYYNGTDYVKVSGTVAVASFQTSLGGLTPSTATTGVVTLAGTLNTTSGGTGLTSFTAGDVPYYASGSVLSKLAIGTAGQFLTSTGTAPQWSTLSGVAVTTFSAGTTGFTPSSATSGAVTLAGTLATTNGGTGLTAFTANQVFYASSTSAFAQSANLTFNGTTLTANTIGAFTLGGTIAGGGNQINNVIIGTTTPLAGAFTTLSATGNTTVGFTGGTALLTGVATSNGFISHFLQNDSTGSAAVTRFMLGNSTSTGAAQFVVYGGNHATLPSVVDLNNANNAALRLLANNAVVAQVNPSGLAVTGTVAGSVYVAATKQQTGFLANSHFWAQGADANGNYAGMLYQMGSGSSLGKNWNGVIQTGSYGLSDFVWLANTTANATNVTTTDEIMRLTNTGNVGIGTSSPNTKLQVNGNVVIGNGTIGAPASGFQLRITNDNTDFYDLGRNSSTGYFISNSSQASPYRGFIWAYGGTAQATLDASGNLGLGVTPAAWNSSYRAFQVASHISLWGNSGGGGALVLANNEVFDASNTRKYLVTDFATEYVQVSGQHQWKTAPSGTAGDTISFTQAMTLDASGNLMVGSTSSSATANKNIDVNGTGDAALNVRVGGTTYAYLYSTAGQVILGTPASIPLTFSTAGTERMRLLAAGRLLVNSTALLDYSTINYSGTVQIAQSGNAQLACAGFDSSSDYGGEIILSKSRSGTIGTNTIVQNGDKLGTIFFAGANGTGYGFAAHIRCTVDGTPGASADMPGALLFSTSPDGSATPTERMRITSAGLVGIGTNNPSRQLELSTIIASAPTGTGFVGGALRLSNLTDYESNYGTGGGNPDFTGSIEFYAGDSSTGTGVRTAIKTTVDSYFNTNSLCFYTAPVNTAGILERMRIDPSGNLLVGTASPIGAGNRLEVFGGSIFVTASGTATNILNLKDSVDQSGASYVQFYNASNGGTGSITRVGTTNAVAYNTTSDYRLKTVTGAVTGQGSRIDALKPIDYVWTEGGQQARGFLAHEFQTVYPNSVTGDKDAVDADGNPKYQAMQSATSEVIADLVAEIQALRKRLADAGI